MSNMTEQMVTAQAEPQQNLTRAARRDLAAILAGHYPALRYGPYEQLLKAGYITGSQENYQVVERQRSVTLIAVVVAESYEGMTDAEIAAMIDREVVEHVGLDSVIEIHAVRS